MLHSCQPQLRVSPAASCSCIAPDHMNLVVSSRQAPTRHLTQCHVPVLYSWSGRHAFKPLRASESVADSTTSTSPRSSGGTTGARRPLSRRTVKLIAKKAGALKHQSDDKPENMDHNQHLLGGAELGDDNDSHLSNFMVDADAKVEAEASTSTNDEASTSAPAARSSRRLPRNGEASVSGPAQGISTHLLRQSSQQQQQQQQQQLDPWTRPSQYQSPVQLRESDPMYTPTLTDEDLDSDPAGHRSGYVAVIGRPNAGKSTLINQIVGQKLSIVSFKPQTTRHRIMGISSDKDYQMILFDTPGIIEKKRTKLEERMMAAVVSSIQNAEAIIAVVDASDKPREALAMFQPGSDWSGPPMAVLLNKSDLLPLFELQELEEWYKAECKAQIVLSGSAFEGTGIPELKRWAVTKLPEGPTLYPKGIISEMPERFFVSEIIREKVFHQYDQEIPYAVQVEILEFKERPGKKDFISAVILVEKESQVSILVGKGGAAMKRLGEAARRDIEAFIERPVYLQMDVKLAKDWREDKTALTQYGYYDSL